MTRMLVALGVTSVLGAACNATASAVTHTASPAAAARAELAATGRLRLGFPANPPFFGQRDAASGHWNGLAIGLGQALAAQLGVSLEPVIFADPEQTYQALASGQVDVVLAPLQVRPASTTGTEAVVSLEHTYLVRSGSPLADAADVDRPGVKVGSVAGSPHTAFLASHLQHAQLEQVATDADGAAALAAGRIDAFAEARPVLAGMAGNIPGSRILNGAFFTPGFGFAVVSIHNRGAAFVSSFVAAALASGQVQRAVDAVGKPGLVAGAVA